MNVPDQEDKAWAAGFFDAEGSFSYSNSNNSAAVSIGQTERKTLERFRQAVGTGSVNGPYTPRAHPNRFSKKPQWSYQVYARASVLTVASLLWPWLGETKRAKALDVLDRAGIPHDLGAEDPRKGARLGRDALAWAAGFMDGEGSFSYSSSARYVCVAITNSERELLERFQRLLGMGKIYGPYINNNPRCAGKKPQFFYRANGYEKVQATLALLWFKLGQPSALRGSPS